LTCKAKRSTRAPLRGVRAAINQRGDSGTQARIITAISAGNKSLKNRPRQPMRGTMRKIADGEDYPMPATIDDPAVLKEIEEALHKSG
jgi:propionyl-CoA synthetase